jgi:hypothetical protein
MRASLPEIQSRQPYAKNRKHEYLNLASKMFTNNHKNVKIVFHYFTSTSKFEQTFDIIVITKVGYRWVW